MRSPLPAPPSLLTHLQLPHPIDSNFNRFRSILTVTYPFDYRLDDLIAT